MIVKTDGSFAALLRIQRVVGMSTLKCDRWRVADTRNWAHKAVPSNKHTTTTSTSPLLSTVLHGQGIECFYSFSINFKTLNTRTKVLVYNVH